jgi:hypothetical protein
MKSLKNILYMLMVVVLVQSCKEKIDLDVPGAEPKVVIESEVTTETDSSYVKITKTADYYSTEAYPAITDATVSVNGVPFTHVANGIYRPASPYKGVTGSVYNLDINAEGQTYTSSSVLEPMYRIDSIYQVYKEKEGFMDAGWAIYYIGIDERPRTKYTYFRIGYFDTIVQHDSLDEAKILFNNTETVINQEYHFELPFTRFEVGEECVMIFRSVTKEMNDFLSAYNLQNSGAPGPFQVPPANLPTNIKGGAIGYFATYDVVRRRYTVK